MYLNKSPERRDMQKGGIVENFIVTIASSLILIVMGMVYFVVTLLIVKLSSGLIGVSPDSNVVVLSSAIIVAGIMIGSAIKNA